MSATERKKDIKKKGTTTGFIPEIVVMYCQNSVSEKAVLRETVTKAGSFKARLSMLPCTGKVDTPHLLKILEDGADGIEIVGCPEGKCRCLVGNTRAQKRVEYSRSLLDQIKMGADRLGMDRGERLSSGALMELAGKRAALVKPLGPNPMKARRTR